MPSIEQDFLQSERRTKKLHSLVQFDPNGGCWFWEGRVTQDGYGSIRRGGKTRPNVYAHRIFYVERHGPVLDGFELDHLCRNPGCVNPDHLEPITHKENLYRSPLYIGNKTHCNNGHEFTPENTRTLRRVKGKTGKPYIFRVCKICSAEATRKFRMNNKPMESVSSPS